MNIRESLTKRKELAALKQNRFVEITSDLYNLVTKSINLANNQRGRALHLLNVGAKKRARPERRERDNELAIGLREVPNVLDNFSDSPRPNQNKRFKGNQVEQNKS